MFIQFHNKNNNYLCITSLFILLGVFYFLLYSKKTFEETALACILVWCFIISELFWNNPIRHSIIHKIDGISAKISISFFILYTLFYKKMDNITKLTYLIIISMISILFYYSNIHSSQDWCCDDHIFYHGLMHMTVFMGITYSFYPS